MPGSSDSELHYLVGGGIASLAAAVFLVRDIRVPGQNIKIFEQLDRVGGSLDGSGNPLEGYLVRGGRMFEPHFTCTADLLDSIPSQDAPGQSLWQDILAFNRDVPGSSKCRLVCSRKKAPMSLGLGLRDIAAINLMLVRPEHGLEDRTIGSCFSRQFFDTNFWIMWSSMFSFQPWHSAVEMRRYLKRFIHLVPGFSQFEGILRTRYNQYESIIAPITEWLVARGVKIKTGLEVSDIHIEQNGAAGRVTHLILQGGARLPVEAEDRVYITLGSMTDAVTRGSNTAPPPLPSGEGPAWHLWRNLSTGFPGIGNPDAFCTDQQKTTWMSFTATLSSSVFFDYMEEFTGNVTGSGGLITITDSSWMLSVVIFHQPHFREQGDDRYVFWGYGLRGDQVGDFIRKPMLDCTGDEILGELSEHLGLTDGPRSALEQARIVTCRMPYITSQFMPRKSSDRPQVCPQGAENFAILGQYCEMPRDTVFTVEYSVRSAMTAVHTMTGRGHPPPPVVRTDCDPLVLYRAARTLLCG